MFGYISNVINEWDPINLSPSAPEDEYAPEIEKISDFIKMTSGLTVDLLGAKIHEVFLIDFGEELFLQSNGNCKNVAENILQWEGYS